MHILGFLGNVNIELRPEADLRHLTRPRSISLLALLAAADRGGVTRDRLVSLLWQETDGDHARHSLSNQLHILRGSLGSQAILSAGGAVRLNPDLVTTDVGKFKQALRQGDLERAAAAYSGPFLCGFHLDGAGEFERWADEERRTLAAQALNVFEVLASQAAARGQMRDAVIWLQDAVRFDPYNSRAAIALAHALAACSDPGNAVQLLRQHARTLSEDLGIDPDPAVLELIETGQFDSTLFAQVPQGLTAPRARRSREPIKHSGWSRDQTQTNDSASLSATVATAHRGRWRMKSAARVAATVLITVGAVFAVRIMGGGEARSDLLVVLPVRPVGGDSGLAEHVSEHLYSELVEWEERTVVRQGEELASWRGIDERPEGEFPAGMGQALGKRIDAGTVLVPTIHQTANRVEVSASLVAVPGGEILAASRAVGPVDSLGRVAHSLVVRLLAEEAGIPHDRIETLLSHDPEAARLYIQSRPHASGMRYRLLHEAIARDSSFALAALALHEASADYHGLEPGGPWEAQAEIVWENRERLSPADRAYAEALLGWRYMAEPTAKLHVEAWERAVEIAPDRLAHWQGLLLECYRWCSEVRRGWRESVLEIHDAVMARGDTSFLERAVEVAFAAEDSVRLVAYGELLPEDAWYGRWLVAVGTNQERERASLVRQFPELSDWSLMRIENAAIMTAVGLEDAERAAAVPERRKPGSIYELRRMVLARERGRHAEYRRLRNKAFQYFDVRRETDALAAANIVFEWGYFGEPETDATLDAVDAILNRILSDSLTVSPDTLAVAHCYHAQLQLLRRDTVDVSAALRFLESDPMAGSLAISRMCGPLVGLLKTDREDRESRLDATRKLLEVMTERPVSLGRGPGMFVVETNLAASANLVLARSLCELGYPETAFQMAERRPYQASLWGLYGFHADFVRTEAWLLAQAGEREAALQRYEKYFRLRPAAPDLESWAEVWEAARGEYAALTASRSD